MTNGNFDTDMIAIQMIKEMFMFGNSGRASALAVDPPAGDRPDHGPEHQPVPRTGGDPMTAQPRDPRRPAAATAAAGPGQRICRSTS